MKNIPARSVGIWLQLYESHSALFVLQVGPLRVSQNSQDLNESIFYYWKKSFTILMGMFSENYKGNDFI